MVRILIADDYEVVRVGLRSILETHPNWEVVAEAGDGREAVQKAIETQPHVAVIAYSMPIMHGVEATSQIPAVSEVLHKSMHAHRNPLNLSDRQRDVLQLVAEGQTNKQIAKALGITQTTVEPHRNNIMSKLNLSSSAALVRYAVSNGMIEA